MNFEKVYLISSVTEKQYNENSCSLILDLDYDYNYYRLNKTPTLNNKYYLVLSSFGVSASKFNKVVFDETKTSSNNLIISDSGKDVVSNMRGTFIIITLNVKDLEWLCKDTTLMSNITVLYHINNITCMVLVNKDGSLINQVHLIEHIRDLEITFEVHYSNFNHFYSDYSKESFNL